MKDIEDKYHPILFSTQMVISILEDIKTETRRIIKPQPEIEYYKKNIPPLCEQIRCESHDAEWSLLRNVKTGRAVFNSSKEVHLYPSKYGKKRDILWVRETFYAYGHWTTITENGKSVKKFHDLTEHYMYKHKFYADDKPDKVAQIGQIGWHKRPALFMPRSICRLFLDITDIRVERLQDITAESAVKEGIHELLQSSQQLIERGKVYRDYANNDTFLVDGLDAKRSFQSLWKSINGPDSWDANPYVWVIEFEKLPF